MYVVDNTPPAVHESQYLTRIIEGSTSLQTGVPVR